MDYTERTYSDVCGLEAEKIDLHKKDLPPYVSFSPVPHPDSIYDDVFLEVSGYADDGLTSRLNVILSTVDSHTFGEVELVFQVTLADLKDLVQNMEAIALARQSKSVTLNTPGNNLTVPNQITPVDPNPITPPVFVPPYWSTYPQYFNPPGTVFCSFESTTGFRVG